MIPNIPIVLSTLAQPFYLTTVDLSTLDNWRYLLRDADPLTAVRLINGKRCHSEPALFSEFAAALQFPLYFGKNWDALTDCLSDLPRWVQTKQSVIIIADADQILCHDEDLPVQCFEVLHNVVIGRSVPIRVVFHCGKVDPAYNFRRTRFLGKLERAKITPTEIS